MARILCILGLLYFVLNTVENTEIEEGFENLQRQQDGLQSLNKLHTNFESTKTQDLIDLIHKFSKSEDEILHRDFKETGKLNKNRRGTESGLTTRKACKMFFWKSRAAC